MKKILLIAFLLTSLKGYSQITLQHFYKNQTAYFVQVDALEQDYVMLMGTDDSNLPDTLAVYSLNHALIQYITLPHPDHSYINLVYQTRFPVVSKNLFTTTGEYDVMYTIEDSVNNGFYPSLVINQANGTNILQVDSEAIEAIYAFGDGVFSTTQGAILDVPTSSGTKIFSLPGTYAAGVPPVKEETDLVGNAYPNPSANVIHLPYNLNGGQNGQLMIVNVSGQFVKQYNVTNAFNDIIINAGDLPKGSYLYYLIANGVKSQAKEFIVQ